MTSDREHLNAALAHVCAAIVDVRTAARTPAGDAATARNGGEALRRLAGAEEVGEALRRLAGAADAIEKLRGMIAGPPPTWVNGLGIWPGRFTSLRRRLGLAFALAVLLAVFGVGAE